MTCFPIRKREASTIALGSILTILLMRLREVLVHLAVARLRGLILPGLIGPAVQPVPAAVAVASATSLPICLVVVRRKKKNHHARNRNAALILKCRSRFRSKKQSRA